MTAKQSMSGVVLPRTSTAYQEEVSAQAVAAPQGYWRAALLAACVLYLSLGSVTLSPNAVVASLIGQGDSMTAFMVQQLRLPRLIAACFTGAAFALAGVLMQTLARNRLATPGIIGIDNGATAFAVASIVGLGVGIAPPAMALAGATTAAVLTFGLAAGSGTQGYRFIVAGIGVGAVFGAVTQLMLARVAIDTANAAYPWTVGSLNARPASAVQLLGIGLALGLVAALALARSLSSARHVPILAATLAGALVMVLADLAGRTLFAPIEIPVGIVTAVVGGPWLLWILMRPQRSRP